MAHALGLPIGCRGGVMPVGLLQLSRLQQRLLPDMQQRGLCQLPHLCCRILSLHRSGMEEPAILGEAWQLWGSIGFLISSAVPYKTDITWKGQILQVIFGNLIGSVWFGLNGYGLFLELSNPQTT